VMKADFLGKQMFSFWELRCCVGKTTDAFITASVRQTLA